ncbi:MAG TPA: hypothetical protein VF585_08720 [Chthoniobacterales bacterium]|jgi:hypothetical protein
MEPLKTEAEILEQTTERLDQQDLEGALRILLQAMTDYQLPTCEVRGFTAAMPALDVVCQEIGRRLLSPASSTVRKNTARRDVYLATEIYAVGGHTALIGDYVGNSPGREAILLLSNAVGSPLAGASAAGRTGIPSERIEICPHESLLEQTRWMIQRLHELQPERVFLLNHPQDPVPVAALQPGLARFTYFVHHADHSPALGVTLTCTAHLDLTPRAYHCCKRLWGVRNTAYVPLQCREPATRARERDTVRTTACSGSYNKFTWEGPLSYPAVIRKMLAQTGVCHIHIGPVAEELLNPWRRRLVAAGIDPDRLKVVPRVTSVWKAMHDFEVDLYLQSFPVPGARAAVEVMGSGTPLLLHAPADDALRAATRLIYPETETWSTAQDLIRRVKSADARWLAAQRGFARRYFAWNHAGALLAAVFQKDPIRGIKPSGFHSQVRALFRREIRAYQRKYLRPTRWERARDYWSRLWGN